MINSQHKYTGEYQMFCVGLEMDIGYNLNLFDLMVCDQNQISLGAHHDAWYSKKPEQCMKSRPIRIVNQIQRNDEIAIEQ